MANNPELEVSGNGTSDDAAAPAAGDFDRLAVYLRAFRNYPPLTDREEFERLFREFKAGSIAARDRILYGHVNLIVWVARKYAGQMVPVVDLVQEGLAETLRLLDEFELEGESGFGHFVIKALELKMAGVVIEQTTRRPYAISRGRTSGYVALVLRAREELFQELQREPNALELLKRIRSWDLETAQEIRLRNVTRVLRMLKEEHISLDAPIKDSRSNNDGKTGTYADVLGQSSVIEAQVDARRMFEQCASVLERIGRALTEHCDDREIEVFKMRYGLDGREAFLRNEVADCLGISGYVIAGIEARVFKRLKEAGLDLDAERIAELQRVFDELSKIVL